MLKNQTWKNSGMVVTRGWGNVYLKGTYLQLANKSKGSNTQYSDYGQQNCIINIKLIKMVIVLTIRRNNYMMLTDVLANITKAIILHYKCNKPICYTH